VDIIFNLRKELHRDEKYGVKHGMQVISIEIPDHQEPTLEQALSFIGQVHHALAYGQKILIHCEHGHGRTSTFAVLARLAQGWTLEHALQEEEEVFHYCFNHPAQKEFLIKNFTNYGQSAQGLAS
jgi:protein-tyrosine phosphatase